MYLEFDECEIPMGQFQGKVLDTIGPKGLEFQIWATRKGIEDLDLSMRQQKPLSG